jgi:hypothetical protein
LKGRKPRGPTWNPRLQRRLDIREPGIPDFTITGFNGFGSAGTNWYQNDSTNQLSDQISWSRGSHNIMAGLEFRRLATGRAAVNSARGLFTFNGTQSGYAPADFILGIPVSFATAGPEIRGRVAGWRDGFFVLDKWQASRKLTINYGLRYELPTVPYTINGVASILNANQTALVVAKPGFKFIAPNHNNWAPRLGIAYRLNDKTVFRAGGGIYYNPNQTNSYTFLNTNPPWSPIFQCTWSSGLAPLSLSNPFAVPAACPLPRQQQRRPDRHTARASVHAAHESMERESATSSYGTPVASSCSIWARIPTISTAASTTTLRCPDRARSTRAGRIRCSARSARSPMT